MLTQHLPASMFQAVELLPKTSQPLILMTRHSIREPADSHGFASYQLPLTPIGRDLAFDWGKWLVETTGLQVTGCLSSPIPRCVDTARIMLQGAQFAHQPAFDHHDKLEPTHTADDISTSLLNIDQPNINQHNLLVEPGSFVTDVAQAGPHFKQYGALKFINAFLQQQLPGMKVPQQGAQDILRLLFEHRPQQAGQLLLAVSHDTILAALFSVMAGQASLLQTDWPEMMEGAFLWFEGNRFEHSQVHWIWRGQYYQFRPYSTL